MKASFHRAGLASVLLLAARLVSAGEPADSGPYVQLDLGTTSFNVHKAGLDEWGEIPSAASSLDRSDTGYSLAAGFRFSPYLAVEAAYLNLGRYSYRVEGDEAAVKLGFGSRGPALSVIGTLPINDTWSLEGRAGAYFAKSKLRARVSLTLDSDDGLELAGSGGSDAGLLLGAGVVASFHGNWSVHLGYDYIDGATTFHDPEPGAQVDSSAGRISLGIRYRF